MFASARRRPVRVGGCPWSLTRCPHRQHRARPSKPRRGEDRPLAFALAAHQERFDAEAVAASELAAVARDAFTRGVISRDCCCWAHNCGVERLTRPIVRQEASSGRGGPSVYPWRGRIERVDPYAARVLSNWTRAQRQRGPPRILMTVALRLSSQSPKRAQVARARMLLVPASYKPLRLYRGRSLQPLRPQKSWPLRAERGEPGPSARVRRPSIVAAPLVWA